MKIKSVTSRNKYKFWWLTFRSNQTYESPMFYLKKQMEGTWVGKNNIVYSNSILLLLLEKIYNGDCRYRDLKRMPSYRVWPYIYDIVGLSVYEDCVLVCRNYKGRVLLKFSATILKLSIAYSKKSDSLEGIYLCAQIIQLFSCFQSPVLCRTPEKAQ